MNGRTHFDARARRRRRGRGCALRRRYGAALGWGGLAAAVLMALVLGVRPDIVQAAGQPMFWLKIAFPAAVAAAAMLATLRLSRPGARLEACPSCSLPRCSLCGSSPRSRCGALLLPSARADPWL